MRLLFFAPANSIHAKRWLEFFSSDPENEVHLATFVDPTVEIDGVVVHRLPLDTASTSRFKRIRNSRRSLREAVEGMRKGFSPDLIHIHSFNPYAYFAAALFRVPIVATPWGSDIVRKKSTSRKWFVRRLARKADSLICDAAHMKERLVALGARPEKVDIIFFGTDVEEYHPRNRDSNLAAELGWDSRALLVVSTRALKPLYDVETLVRAVPIVAGRVPEARFLIVGDGEERARLESLVRELDVTDRVRFVGRVSDFDMKRMVASADVYVSTALSDGGLAASTAEAMASGVPVVVTDFGDNGEWLGHGQAGFSFPARASAALATHVVGLLKDPAARSSMGARGRQIISERNNYRAEMAKVARVYQSLLR